MIKITQLRSQSIRLAYRQTFNLVNTSCSVEVRHRLLGHVFADDNTRIFIAIEASCGCPRLVGGISFSVLDDCVKIHALASFEPGVGTKLIREAERVAKARGTPVKLQSLRESDGFYLKRGYKDMGDDVFELPASKTNLRVSRTSRARMPQIGVVLDSQKAEEPHQVM